MSSSESAEKFRHELLASGLLVDCGVPGIYGRSAVFEEVIARFDAYVSGVGAADGATSLRFPPVLSRAAFEQSGYLKNMPQLAGMVQSFSGEQADHVALIHDLETGADYRPRLGMTDVVLTPAACYPLYPTQTGELAAGGRLFDIYSYCFRHEPSLDPARMQSFRMREYVRLGAPEDVCAFRARWLERGQRMLAELELDAHVALANDPFFGRTGRMLAANQREQELKYELVIPITSTEQPTAVMSFNYHQELFGKLYEIRLDREPAHTACVGFGMERIALALFKKHGFEPQSWPRAVREQLWP
ncbi:MAG TPA: amino acid--[acyl-carrier-protein] ligase [Polyangiaceae bacterium]